MPQIPYNTSVGVNYKYVSGTTPVTIKSGAGYLEGIIVDNAGSAGTITIYDNTTNAAPQIAVATVASAFVAPGGVTYGLLTVVLGGTTPPTVTFLYR